MNLLDAEGDSIGDTHVDERTNPLGDGINDGKSYTGKLLKPIVLTGGDDYVRFKFGDLECTSKQFNEDASCKIGGWRPKEGPVCGETKGNRNVVNKIDCSFQC